MYDDAFFIRKGNIVYTEKDAVYVCKKAQRDALRQSADNKARSFGA